MGLLADCLFKAQGAKETSPEMFMLGPSRDAGELPEEDFAGTVRATLGAFGVVEEREEVSDGEAEQPDC